MRTICKMVKPEREVVVNYGNNALRSTPQMNFDVFSKTLPLPLVSPSHLQALSVPRCHTTHETSHEKVHCNFVTRDPK